jgi:threonine/homoserine/homoserine lactone efflux protein
LLDVVIDGVLLGFVLILFIGPSFFYLIKVSLEKGFIPAIFFALGIILSDLAMISLIYLGFSTIFESKLFQEVFSVIAGLVLIVLGAMTFIRDNSAKGIQVRLEQDHHPIWYMFKGILINGVNPFTFMIWVGIVGGVGVQQDYSDIEFRYFFTGLLCTILVADILQAYGANRIRLFLNEKLVRNINRILAVIFIILGARLILFFFSLLFDWEGIF